MRLRFFSAAVLLAVTVGFVSSAAAAAPEGWHTSMKDGLEAAAKSNRPLLVITAWARKL